MGMATTVGMLVVSRIPVGVFKQTVTLSQALMTDLTGLFVYNILILLLFLLLLFYCYYGDGYSFSGN